MLCKFGKKITIRIISTLLESRNIVNYLTIWQINNLYTNKIVGFSIVKHIFLMEWFLAEKDKSAIYHTKSIALF